MDKYTLAAAAHKLVQAYKQVTSAMLAELGSVDLRVETADTPRAPTNFVQLLGQIDAGLLVVSYEHGDTAIYGRDGNISFRTMHDIGHVLYQLNFSFPDEVELAHILWRRISEHIPAGWVTTCHRVYLADTVGQALYERRVGKHPKNQTEFVLNWLKDH